MTPEQRFADYIAAFNRQDWPALCAHYDSAVELVIGNGTTLRGHQAVVDFYRRVNEQTRRTIEVLDCFADGDLLTAELQSEFVAITDAPDFTSGPLSRGDRIYLNSFAFYEIRGGMFARVRAATFRRTITRA